MNISAPAPAKKIGFTLLGLTTLLNSIQYYILIYTCAFTLYIIVQCTISVCTDFIGTEERLQRSNEVMGTV